MSIIKFNNKLINFSTTSSEKSEWGELVDGEYDIFTLTNLESSSSPIKQYYVQGKLFIQAFHYLYDGYAYTMTPVRDLTTGYWTWKSTQQPSGPGYSRILYGTYEDKVVENMKEVVGDYYATTTQLIYN